MRGRDPKSPPEGASLYYGRPRPLSLDASRGARGRPLNGRASRPGALQRTRTRTLLPVVRVPAAVVTPPAETTHMRPYALQTAAFFYNTSSVPPSCSPAPPSFPYACAPLPSFDSTAPARSSSSSDRLGSSCPCPPPASPRLPVVPCAAPGTDVAAGSRHLVCLGAEAASEKSQPGRKAGEEEGQEGGEGGTPSAAARPAGEGSKGGEAYTGVARPETDFFGQ